MDCNQKGTLVFLFFSLVCLGRIEPTHGGNAANKITLPVDAYIWELEPFIYTNNDGVYMGMMQDYFNEYTKYVWCMTSNTQMIRVKHKYRSKKEFLAAFEDIQSGKIEQHPEFQNGTNVSYWFPLLQQNVEQNPDTLVLKQPLYGTSISIVTHEFYIDIVYKFFILFTKLYHMMIIFFSTAVLFAVFMLVFDQNYNWGSGSIFTLGVARGLWWSIITMTTVGYGDVAPKRFLARISGSMCMIFGLLISATITAQVSEDYKNAGIKLENVKEVGVVHGTYEATVMKETLMKNLVEFDTYEELIEALQFKKNITLIALNSDVAAYKQTTWNENVPQEHKLAVIKELPRAEAPIYYAMYGDIKNFKSELSNGCYNDMPKQAAKQAMYKNRKKVQVRTTFKMPIITMLTEHQTIVIVIYVFVPILVLGVTMDLFGKLKAKTLLSREEVVFSNNFVHLNSEKQRNETAMMKITKADIVRMAKEIAEIRQLTTEMTKTSQEPEEEC